ncbi:hypothetical protein MRB53_038933 [Persea americana]|nr:hypothetical protein MRB53_038933 [Persea americana]
MDSTVKSEPGSETASTAPTSPDGTKKTGARKSDAAVDNSKRRCVSTACIACRRRKSKCDGNTPACAACSSVYKTECVYDPGSDLRRKGVYKRDIDNLKTRNSTLQTLVQAILNYPQDEVPELVRQIRTCESLDKVAETILAKDNGEDIEDEYFEPSSVVSDSAFESQLSGKMGELRVEDGTTRYFGGTSNLIYVDSGQGDSYEDDQQTWADTYQTQENPITSWSTVTTDPELITHLLNMYFTWHYTFFTTLSKSLFYKEFLQGKPRTEQKRKVEYCTPLLVNAMLSLGCHFTSAPMARSNPEDPHTAGDHFFNECRRLIKEEDAYEKPKLATVQALALMSVREAGCGRENKGWTYSGISFRMACDLGLNFKVEQLMNKDVLPGDEEEDARRITFWGCFLFDKYAQRMFVKRLI